MEEKHRQILIRFLNDGENRTFLTWQDLGDVKEALVQEGLWSNFQSFANIKWIEDMTETWFIDWLFRPIDENGNCHFCKLVVEFMEKGKQ